MEPRRLLPALAVVTALLLAVTVVALGWRSWAPGPASSPTARDGTAPAARPAGGADPRDRPAAILAAWDARRARAWASGDGAALRGLYAAGSRAGAADVRLLGEYARRGLRVTGLQTQVLDLAVLSRSDRRLHVVVTDRVVGGEAVGRGGRVTLPSDRASTRHVVLVRVGDRWLVDRVTDRGSGRPQPRAAARTSRTSRSSKS